MSMELRKGGGSAAREAKKSMTAFGSNSAARRHHSLALSAIFEAGVKEEASMRAWKLRLLLQDWVDHSGTPEARAMRWSTSPGPCRGAVSCPSAASTGACPFLSDVRANFRTDCRMLLEQEDASDQFVHVLQLVARARFPRWPKSM